MAKSRVFRGDVVELDVPPVKRPWRPVKSKPAFGGLKATKPKGVSR